MSVIYSFIMNIKNKDILPHNHMETFDFMVDHLIDSLYEYQKEAVVNDFPLRLTNFADVPEQKRGRYSLTGGADRSIIENSISCCHRAVFRSEGTRSGYRCGIYRRREGIW